MELIESIVGAEEGSGVITIVTNLRVIEMFHHQDCCESVEVEDVIGDVQKAIGAEFLEIITKSDNNGRNNPKVDDSCTYTFYTLKHSRGYLDIRWFGTSNGYYSEAVTLLYSDR